MRSGIYNATQGLSPGVSQRLTSQSLGGLKQNLNIVKICIFQVMI